MRNTKTFDIVLFIVSLSAGIVAWIIGNIFYSIFDETMSKIIIVGIVFFILYLVLTVSVVVLGIIRDNWEDYVLFLNSRVAIITTLILGGLLIGLLGSLFQFIYGLSSEEVSQGPTSYIFVIDDSGSMMQSDPDNIRYKAIEEILEGMPETFPYMIYSFSNTVQRVRDMKPISEGMGEIPSQSSGGTAIRAALIQVMEDYENQVWVDDQRPKVILLTDGYAGDIGFFSPITRLLNKYAKKHISISTVGLGVVDTKLMTNIADSTKGIFVSVQDAKSLKEAMENAAQQYSSERDLLEYRISVDKEWLYVMMRIAFLTILGILIGFMMIFATTKEEDWLLIIVSSAIKSIVGGMIMEVGIQVLSIPSKVMWLLLWILIAIIISTIEMQRGRTVRGTYRDYGNRTSSYYNGKISDSIKF